MMHVGRNIQDKALLFAELRAKTEASGGPPPLSPRTLMKESMGVKLKNMIDNIAADLVAPVEIIARKY